MKRLLNLKIIFLILIVIIISFSTLVYNMPSSFVLWEIRIPRLVILILIASMLSLAGDLLQKVTQNPLADPGIIGINQGAGLSIAFVLFYTGSNYLSQSKWIPLWAILGGIIITSILLTLSIERKKLNTRKLVLNGIGLNAVCTSLIILLMTKSHNELKIDFMMKWLSGNLWSFEWMQIFFLGIIFFASLTLIIFFYPELCILSLSENHQKLLGLNTKKYQILFLLVIISLTSSAVAYAGGLVFLGLLAPHIAKYYYPINSRVQWGVTILIGIILLLISDGITQLVFPSIGLSQGVILSFIGAPYFIYLVIKK